MDINTIKEVLSVVISQTQQGLNLSQYSFTDISNIVKTGLFYLMILANLILAGYIIVHWIQFGRGEQDAGKKIMQAVIALAGVDLVWIIVAIILKMTGASTQVVGALN